jgi:hypothetical protein
MPELTPKPPSSWDVMVRLYDAINNKLSETSVMCTAKHPGEACPPAYVVAREDAKRAEVLQKVAGVVFLVRLSKPLPGAPLSGADAACSGPASAEGAL